MPDASAAIRAADVIGLAPAIGAFAKSYRFALFLTKRGAIGIDRQEVGRARKFLAIAAMAGDRRQWQGVVRITHRSAKAPASIRRVGNGRTLADTRHGGILDL
jgi:hypothetical protein